MGSSGAGPALAAFLTELKQRSGLSYEQLARKTHLGRSTVHRYCTGLGVPSTFAPVESIATACRASRADVAKLYRLWERADLARVPSTVDTVPAAPVPEPVPEPRRRVRLPIVAVLVAVLLAGGAVAVPRDAPSAAEPDTISAPMWTRAPRAVAPEFIGVTTNTDTGLMPTFPVGSVRFWDSATRWHLLEPARGQYRWDTLDRMVAGARDAGLAMTYTFGGTPEWASPTGTPTVYGDGSRADPPDDLADWQRFVRAVAQRYRGTIGAYELWDMANHPSFFAGSMAEMVELTRLASTAIRAADPAATVVCPSMGELWDPAALGLLREFAELDGYRHCDAAAVKLSARTASEPPESMLALAHDIENTLHSAGTGLRLWSTGTAYDVPQQTQPDEDRGADHAARFFLTGLYAQLGRMYFYSWGSSTVPIVLQPVGGPETKAGRHVGRLYEWLAGSRIHACGQGRAAGLPDGLWQCRFDRDGATFLIWWTVDTTLRLAPAAGTTSVERLDGTTAPGGTVTVTGSPILLRVG